MGAATAEKQQVLLQHYFGWAGVREEFPFAHGIVLNPEYKPEPHQISGLNQALGYDRFGLYDEPGCMKTLVSQGAALYMAGYGNKVVVIMPPVLLEQYEEEFDKVFLGWRNYFTMHVLKDPPDKRAELFEKWRATEWPDLMLLSYQQFAKLPRQRKKKDKETGESVIIPPNPDDNISHVLKEAGYNYIIADEAHALKNPGSNQHKCVKYMVGQDGGLLLMTGTPIPNELTDAYGLIDLVTPGKYASMKSFERLHCIYSSSETGHEVLIGYQNRDTMSRHLYAQARRVRRDDVMTLKKAQVIEVPINLDPAHYRLYKKLVRERFLEKGDEIITALNQQSLRQKSLQIVTTPELFTDQPVKNEIITGVDQLLDSIGLHDEKVVIFANYQNAVEALAEHLKRYNPAMIYGGKGSNDANKRKFLTDDTCRVLVANPRSGGVGLNLQSVCRWIIFAEPTSVPGDFKQASERVQRKGQKRAVTIYILKALGTGSPQLTKNMLKKEGEVMGIMKDSNSMLAELMGEVT